MENEIIKEYNLIFKAYQRMLLRELELVQEAVKDNDTDTVESRLQALIEDTRAALND